MRRFIAAVLLFFAFASANVSAQTETTKVLPSDWVPALSPSITAALQNLKGASSRAEMNTISRQVADMTDAQLFVAYVRLYNSLSPKERATLVTEQTKWLKARTKAAQAAVESESGSLAALEANNAEVTFTEKRLAELRARLKTAGKKAKPTDD